MDLDLIGAALGGIEREEEKELTLTEQIAEHREKKRVAKAMEAVHAENEEFVKSANPTIGMSTAEKLGAGFQSGLRDVGRNIGNMVGLVDDEEIAESDKLEAALRDTGAGGAGAFAGEMAALAPLGLGGSAAKAGLALSRAKGLGSALNVAKAGLPSAKGAGLGRALVEGAGASAILADPNERDTGALTGALVGGGLNKTIGALGRKFTHGVSKSKAGNEFAEEVGSRIGREAQLPVAQSTDAAIPKFIYKNVLPMFPFARGGNKSMLGKAQKDWAEAVLEEGMTKEAAAAARKVLTETGSFAQATKAGLALMKPGANKQSQEVFRKISDDMLDSDLLTPQMLDKASKGIAEGSARPFYQLSSVGKEAFGESLEESTVASRKMFNTIEGAFSPGTKAAGLGALLNPAAALPIAAGAVALGGASRAATSAPMQNMVMGRSTVNKVLKELEKYGSPYANALRNTIAGQ